MHLIQPTCMHMMKYAFFLKTSFSPKMIIFQHTPKIPFGPKIIRKTFSQKMIYTKSNSLFFQKIVHLIRQYPMHHGLPQGPSACPGFVAMPSSAPSAYMAEHPLRNERCPVPRPARTWPDILQSPPAEGPRSRHESLVRSHCRPATIQGTLLSLFRSRVTRGAPPR